MQLGAGAVCSSFSQAVNPPCRTWAFPRGRPGLSPAMQRKVKLGNTFSDWVARLVSLCLDHGVHFWIENPSSSWLWRQRCWRRLRASALVGEFLTDYCRWGMPWRKRTLFLTSNSAADTRLLCDRTHKHIILRGYANGQSLTKTAEPYPYGLADTLALCCCRDCGWSDTRRKLDIAACARCSCRRIVEAPHPGPQALALADTANSAASYGPRRLPFPEGPRVEPQTQRLGDSAISGFLAWVRSDVCASVDLPILAAVPRLLDELLRNYARHLYYSEARIHVLRHLLAALQRRFLHLRRHLPNAWSALSTWEMLEPVRHRPPVPEPLAQALIAVSLSWQWIRTAAIIAAIFYGITRPGELIGATRANLLLPSDLLSSEPIAYICHELPKTRYRGARIQHSTIEDPAAVRLLTHAFGSDSGSTPLFAASASVFRARFALLLRALGMPPGLFTPGGLRGGGACAAFRLNRDVTLLCWRMRLSSPATLSHYLQEAVAASSFRGLPEHARRAVRAASLMLPVLIHRL